MSADSYSVTIPVSLPALKSTGQRVQGTLASLARVSGIDSDTLVTVVSRCCGMLGGLLTGVITARALDPSGRGQYFLALTTAQLVMQFGNLGLPSSNTYFVARDRSFFSGLLTNSAWVSFLAMPIIAVLLVVPSWGGQHADLATYWCVIVLAPMLAFSLLGSGLLLGTNRFARFNLLQVMGSTAALPFMIVAAGLHAGPRGFLIATCIGSMATSAAMWRSLVAEATVGTKFRFDVFGATFNYSTKVYLATLAGFIVLRVNVFTLHALAGPAQVGYYSVASQICDPIAILPQSIALIMFPRLAATATGRLSATVRGALQTAALLLIICLAVAIVADPAIRFAFGAKFAPAAPVVRAMLPGVLFLGVMSVVSQYLAASGFPVTVVATWIAGVGMSTILGRVLVIRYGAVGAAATLSLTYGVLLVGLMVLCWKTAKAQTVSRLV